jgi:hypothetical protein
MSDIDRRQRSAARRERMVLHKGRLAAGERDLSPVDGEEAISLVTALTRESWSEARQPMPTYKRSEIPIRFVPTDRR